MNEVSTLNVEADFPGLEDARRTVMEALRRAKREKVRVLKVIHGYGSSGKGGTLKNGLRKSFGLRKKEGVIRDFVPGEAFSIFDPRVLAMMDEVPSIKGDPDLEATNEGVTVVWIR